jgi:predicted trehalose synthase
MRSRAADAGRVVEDLAGREAAIAAVLERAAAAEWPAFQRIHGDYHLGQVLLVPGRGWVLLDFEGEPLRPMAERSEPDVPLRDVAGMLRSFDYVAGTLVQQGGDADRAHRWAADARSAFLAGYEAELGASLTPYRPLLDAFELDKALYECVYEARNRPTWLPIPRDAVLRLTGEAA